MILECFVIVHLRRTLLSRLLNLFGGVNEPFLKARLAESRVIARNQRLLTHLDAVIASVWVGDDLAGILKLQQRPPDEFIQTKLFRPADLNEAIDGWVRCDSGKRTGNIIG